MNQLVTGLAEDFAERQVHGFQLRTNDTAVIQWRTALALPRGPVKDVYADWNTYII